MQNILPYELIKKFGEGPQSQVYLGFLKGEPDKLLAIKSISKHVLSENQKNYFRQKIEHLKVLTDPNLLIPKSFSEFQNQYILTRDYSDYLTLDIWKKNLNHKLKLNDFFSFAINAVRLIQNIHHSGIIHGGIKPTNILIDPKTLEINVVDFISPLDVRNVSHFIYDRRFVEGTLAYTSPEQTGRINHRVEFTTDIYSLGIIFYELLTGTLPFQTNDPLELIHSHLAEEANLAHELNIEIPPSLSRIIEKMILKQPEKRYQGGGGLIVDLLKVQQDLLSEDFNHFFRLGLEDRTHRITFISKMVGRDRESELILNAFDFVSKGNFGSAFISGFSGIGKTRLIQELQKPIVKNKGYFTSGKFDVYQKNIPYSSLIQAFRNLTRTFLTESDERVEKWKTKIIKAVEKNGKVITDVIPEVEILIGVQPEVMALPPVEARNRFLNVFGSFLSAIASEETPLVLFIDDLQWCDIASFEFLQSIYQNHKEHPYLLLLGAYRHNEVDSSHPLSKIIKQIKFENRPLIEIQLGPILPEHTHEMVAYILDSTLEETISLAQFIGQLTDGNPLFVSESLSYLYNEKLLYFNELNGQWTWNIEKIRSSEMPSSVVELFSSKVHKLPRITIELLEYCACMGNLFTPDELSLVKEISLLDTFETLKPALSQGLLIENKDQLQFVHDKVQEATLAFIDKDKRMDIHKIVGLHLFNAIEKNADFDKLENIFTISSHLNIASRLACEKNLEIPIELQKILIKVNYHAGNSALNSLATDAANEYYKISKEWLTESSWDEDYERTFNIHKKLAKTELMVGKYESSEILLNQLLDSAKSDLDKTEALAEQTTSLSSIGNFNKAIETANRGLSYFKKDIPMDPGVAKKRCLQLMSEIHSDSSKNVWSTILNMPFTKDRKNKIELSFYSELIPDLYMSGLVDQLYLAAAQSTQHCLSGGMDESVIYSFSIMGLNLGENQKFEEAFKYEDLAKDLSEKYPNTFGSTRGMNGVVWCNMHSRSHPEEIVNYCLKSIQSGKNCGDLYNAGLSYGPLMWNLQVSGKDFREIEFYAKECLSFSQKFHLSFSVGLAEAVLNGWVGPMNENTISPEMESKVELWKSANHIASIGSYYVLLAISKYYFGEYDLAKKYFDTVQLYLHGLTDNVLKRQWFIFDLLNNLRILEADINNKIQSSDSIIEFEKKVTPVLELVKTWSSLGPLLKPYVLLLEAELYRLKVGFNKAVGLYFELFQICFQQEYIFLLGYVHEILAVEFKKLNNPMFQYHLDQAILIYKKVNALWKIQLLSHQIPIQEIPLNYFDAETANRASLIQIENSNRLNLDLEYLLKSSHTISAEMNTESLMKKIMKLVIEYSGAQYGCIVILENNDLFIVAESEIKNKNDILTKKYPLENSTFVCKSLVRFVHRTGESIILKNATEDGLFVNNSEVQSKKIKSIFCLPLMKQQKQMGLIYLENRLVPDIFRPQVSEMILLLSTQISISIENARLIEDMRVAQIHINDSLKEKEILLKEIHHRVKNNLQVISSIFNMKSRTLKDPEALALLKESQNRIRSIALVHEKLHYSKTMSQVDFTGYLQFLIPHLVRAYGYDGAEQKIQVEIKICNCELNIDIAMPLGLIVNEILSNCFKHAFPEGNNGKLNIEMVRVDNIKTYYELLISDNGVGVSGNIDSKNKSSIGLQLIHTLSEQIDAQIETNVQNGTQYKIRFSV